MIINLDSWNKRWILEKLHFRVRFSIFFKAFRSFRFDSPFIFNFKPSMMIMNKNEKVLYVYLDLNESFRWDSSENLNPGCVLDASGKFCKETENKSVLDPLLLHWSNSNFDFFVFSPLWTVIAQFFRIRAWIAALSIRWWRFELESLRIAAN